MSPVPTPAQLKSEEKKVGPRPNNELEWSPVQPRADAFFKPETQLDIFWKYYLYFIGRNIKCVNIIIWKVVEWKELM